MANGARAGAPGSSRRHPQPLGVRMKNQNFDDLMASMGVRKLDRGEKRKSTSSAVPNKLRTKTRKAGTPLSTSPKKDLSPELATLRFQIDALKKELASTQSRLEEQAKAFSEAKESSERAQMALSKARQDVERLEAEVTVWNGESDAGEGLLASLSRRGLKGEDERRDALMALGKRRELDALLKRLKVVEPSMVQRQLARRLVLCCGQEVCETAAGVATIVVGNVGVIGCPKAAQQANFKNVSFRKQFRGSVFFF